MVRVLPFAFFVFSLTLVAQEIRENHQDYLLSVDVALVQLPVSVLDRNGTPVQGLKKEDFQVYEDNALQQISLFKQEDVPASIGLVIDNSDSMRNKRYQANDAAISFVRESNPEDETFIVRFDDTAYLEQDFTREIGELTKVLDTRDTRGSTALYDAVYLAAEHLQDSKNDKKAMLLISDGEDNVSKHNSSQVVQRLRRSKAALYVIGLLEERGGRGRFFGKPSSQKVLTKFAEMTGGRAYFPKDIDQISRLGKQIAHDLRSHYTIGYTSSNRKLDGSWRNVRVKLNPPKDLPRLTLETPQGYYAPNQQP